MIDEVEVLSKDEVERMGRGHAVANDDEFLDYDPNDHLNPRQMLFVEFYMTGDRGIRYNATESYLQAYSGENATFKNKQLKRNSARVAGGGLLSLNSIKIYQRYITRNTGFNHESVDNKLKDLIFESHGRDSVIAIREYNKLNSRIINKSEHVVVDANRLLDQLNDKEGDNY